MPDAVAAARTSVGDVYVARTAREDGVVFGEEPSGAWIWPDETPCPDGPLAARRLAELVHERGLFHRPGTRWSPLTRARC